MSKKTKTCKQCGNEYIGRGKYFCGTKCMGLYKKENPDLYPNPSKGRKQSKEHIEKRVRNTDQKKKEEARAKAMLEKYGVTNWSQTEEGRRKLSETHKGSRKERSEEHQQKIVESKKKNGTSNHRPETKKAISDKLKEYYQRDDVDFSYLAKGEYAGRGHTTGYFNNIYYRSSYELNFLEFCEMFKMKVVSAENKNHMVVYLDEEGRKRRYFPDFYLPDFKTTVEIKPNSMVDYSWEKIESALFQVDNYIVITETDGLTNKAEWDMMYNEIFKPIMD